jgi:peptidoglycan/xylan/chitin deacetylase (PgdA/CDA1 family)
LAIIENRESISEPVVLITFDDGYRDNFNVAFPILKRHGVEAIFFLVTSSIATNQVPWWDEIAYLAKLHAPKVLQLRYPSNESFDLAPENFERSLRRVLNLFKSAATTDPARFLTMLREAVGVTDEDLHADLMMSWNDAREMSASGMTIGLHTHSHRILSKLSLAEQVDELKHCKGKLESELNTEAIFLSYPVGSRDTFNDNTFSAVREVGLRAAFSFYGGTNRVGKIDPFDVRRFAFESYAPASRVRLSTALTAITGASWL